MYGLQQFTLDGQAYTGQFVPQQLMPQGFFGDVFGRSLNNTYGCGPSGSLGQRIPTFAPLGVDPLAFALSNQQTPAVGYAPQQLMPQSLFSGLLGQRFSQSHGCGPSGSLGQRMPGFGLSPFDVDPVSAAYAYQQALAMQAML